MMKKILAGNCYGEFEGNIDCSRCRWRKICDFHNIEKKVDYLIKLKKKVIE